MKSGIPIMETEFTKERKKQYTRYQNYLKKLSQRMAKSRRRCRR